MHDSDLRARGPLSVDNDNKENNGRRCIVDDSDNLRPIIIDGSNVAMRLVLLLLISSKFVQFLTQQYSMFSSF